MQLPIETFQNHFGKLFEGAFILPIETFQNYFGKLFEGAFILGV
jgi:hypothetical protein